MRLRSMLTFCRSSLIWASLLTVILLVGCAPASATETTPAEAPVQPSPVANEPEALSDTTPTLTQPVTVPTESAATQAPTEIPQVAVTSRGPDLEATDPSTVSLKSGDLHFVEFFRFT